MKKILIYFLLPIIFTGCSSVILVGNSTSEVLLNYQGDSFKDKVHNFVDKEPSDFQYVHGFWFFGLGQSKHLKLAEVCPDKDLLVFRAFRSKQDSIYTIATGTIYSPRTFQAWCHSKGSVEKMPPPEEAPPSAETPQTTDEEVKNETN